MMRARSFVCGLLAFVALPVVLGINAAADPALERADTAARFVDSIGVNVHLSYHDTGYAKTSRVIALLQTLGVRHLRDGVTLGQDDVCRTDRALAQRGVHFTYITQAHPTSTTLRAWASCVGLAIEAFEGLNEYDISHPPAETDWIGTLRASQHELYRRVKSSRELAALPVIGPSLTTDEAFRSVGDLSADLDAGNIHDYFSFHEPETGGWGLNGFGSIAFNMHAAQAVSSSKPIVATETGYGTDRSSHAVDDATQAIYLPRLFLEQFAAGIGRTYAYELLDEGGPPYDHYGIVDAGLQPKPAFVALSSLIAALRSTSAPRRPGSLRIAISGASQDVHHVLLQTARDRYVLAIWLGATSCDLFTHTVRANATQDVTIAVADAIRAASVSTYGADWRLHRSALSPAMPVRLSVTDRVTLVEFAGVSS